MYTYIEGEASAVRDEPRADGVFAVEFHGWLGDDLLDLAGDWVISGRLAEALRASTLDGYRLAPAAARRHPEWVRAEPQADFPTDWERLEVTGTPGSGADFVTAAGQGLTVSEAAMALLGRFTLAQARLAEVEPPSAPVESDEERLARLRAANARNRAEAEAARAERERVAAEHHAVRQEKCAAALQRFLAAHPDGAAPISGLVSVFSAAIGKKRDDPLVEQVLAVVDGPFEESISGPARRRELTLASPAEGFVVRFVNDKLNRVSVVTRPNSLSDPFARTGELIEGLNLADAAPWDVVEVLGEPVAQSFRQRGYQLFLIGKNEISLGLLNDRVDSLGVGKAPVKRA